MAPPAAAPTQEELEVALLDRRPRRHPAIHWAAIVGSIVSAALFAWWFFGPQGAPDPQWALIDLILSAGFLLEYFTRSGFRWAPARYTATHLFDFVAMAPVLAIVRPGHPDLEVALWLVLAARSTRVLDRLLGDGFVRRNVLALVVGLEEELTDRVMLRILARVEGGLMAGQFGRAVGHALEANREPVLAKIRSQHVVQGLPGELAHIAGLDKILERAEEDAYNAIVIVLTSEEVDRTLRDMVSASFANMRAEIQVKEWRQRLGFKPPIVLQKPPQGPAPPAARSP